MKNKQINQLRKAIVVDADSCETVPLAARQAIVDVLPFLKGLTHRDLPTGATFADHEDAESEALLHAFAYIRKVLNESVESHSWSRYEWQKRIYSRYQNGVRDSIKYFFYPHIPKPLRLSIKKYMSIISVLQKYSKDEDIISSDLYKAIVYGGCTKENLYNECQRCKFKFERCPLDDISVKDLVKMDLMLLGETKSIASYALKYRKSYEAWLETIEELKDMVINTINPDMPDTQDIEQTVVIGEVKEEMNAQHPDLFDVYCFSLTDTDVDILNKTHVMKTPNGWLNHQIKDHYQITSEEMLSLLNKGDAIVNHYRTNLGLKPLQRNIHQQSSK